MILALVPNPSLDRVALVPAFKAGGDFHAEQVIPYAGGKGFHFARALKTLGGRPLVIAPLGGETGEFVARLAFEEGIACDVVPIIGETRTGLVIVNPDGGEITGLYEPGPELLPVEWAQIAMQMEAHFASTEYLAVSGSLPHGAPPDALLKILNVARQANIPSLLDTYGSALSSSLPAKPAVVKINQHEAGSLLDQPVSNAAEALHAARQIQTLGAQAVVITLGAQGAVGVDDRGSAFAWSAPKVRIRFPVGSGDSFFAGLAFGLTQGAPLAAAARLGVAVGTANALTLGPGVMDIAQISALLAQVQEMK